MTRALVVYESMFGNSEMVAQAVADGIAEVMSVALVDVSKAPTDLRGVDLVVAGGPTHVFSMSREGTRRTARGHGATHGSVETGLRDWLWELPDEHRHWFAAFDTKATTVRRLPGSASHSAAKASRHHGFHEAIAPESFYVLDVEGPLVEGELERARAWGRAVAASVPVTA